MTRPSIGWVLATLASVLVTVAFGLLVTGGARSTCVTGKGEGTCPAPLTGPDGTAVRDRYYFVHQPLRGDGSITARVSDMTGLIRLPDAVPGVRNVTKGVVPWAKAGLLVRQSLKQGTPYAAVMVTAEHGVRMQHDFTHDVPGGPVQGPKWLRLTRSGDTLTGHESNDGTTWTKVGTARLAGLPATVEIGMFATSPSDLRGLTARLAQATATFDQVGLQGANGPWQRSDVGVVMEEDGRTPHHPGEVVESGGRFTVTGGGDIGPATMEGGMRADLALLGGSLGLIPILVMAALSARRPAGLAARARTVGATAFATGLVSAGTVVPTGLALLRANRNPVQPITLATELRVIIGYAALTALAALLTLGLATLVRRSAVAVGLAVTLLVVPHLLAILGLTPWLLTFTPAAGFAITQSVPSFAHMDAPVSPVAGYYPLPPWAGLAVLCGYAALTLGFARINTHLSTKESRTPQLAN